MEIGMIGLGRMGANMSRRLMRFGHSCVVYDVNPQNVQRLAKEGATGATSLEDFVAKLAAPRHIWMMVPFEAVEPTVQALMPLLKADDVMVDGGNSYYRDSMRRAREASARKLHYVDVGTSGGLWGLERGFCLMLGGDETAVRRLTPVLEALAPHDDPSERTSGRSGSLADAERGFYHCGPSGTGHFAKMVHNGIEYGMMAAYAEGMNLLQHAKEFDFNIGEMAELWRRGSVIRSWLLDLIAHALLHDPQLHKFGGVVGDSGEGRWTVQTAIDNAVPVPVLSAALFERFSSRGESEFARKLLSAMRSEFGGHGEPDAWQPKP